MNCRYINSIHSPHQWRILIRACAGIYTRRCYLARYPVNLRVGFFDFPGRSFHAFFRRDSQRSANAHLLKLPAVWILLGLDRTSLVDLDGRSGLPVNLLKYYGPSLDGPFCFSNILQYISVISHEYSINENFRTSLCVGKFAKSGDPRIRKTSVWRIRRVKEEWMLKEITNCRERGKREGSSRLRSSHISD